MMAGILPGHLNRWWLVAGGVLGVAELLFRFPDVALHPVLQNFVHLCLPARPPRPKMPDHIGREADTDPLLGGRLLWPATATNHLPVRVVDVGRVPCLLVGCCIVGLVRPIPGRIGNARHLRLLPDAIPVRSADHWLTL